MLSFAAEFPVRNDRRAADFIDAIRSWVLDSPHTTFSSSDLAALPTSGEWSTEKENQRIELLSISSGEEESVAIRHTIVEGELEWVTVAVFSRKAIDTWVGIRTSRESHYPIAQLPSAKKPVIIRVLLEKLGGSDDGQLPVSQHPRILTNNEIDVAARLMSGQANCHLPVVYVSCNFAGTYTVNVHALAHELAGMAHVVIEPNRPFSRRLQIEVASENVYGGTVGIYWPDGAGQKSFFFGRDLTNRNALKHAIEAEVRTALLHRRPLFRCTWPAVQEAFSKQIYEGLKASGSLEVEKYVEAFDAESKAKEEKLAGAEREIERLRHEIRRYETKSSSGTGLNLRIGAEQDLYDEETYQIVLDSIAEAAERSQIDGRRQHVLKSILNANNLTDRPRGYREKLKEILRSYRTMDSGTRRSLETMGFSICDDGKHYKLVFRGDERYTFILAKSGSDYRGGLNAASDIAKRLF